MNDWRAANKTNADVICAPVLDGIGAIQEWINNATFAINMRKTTIPFLLEHKIKYMGKLFKKIII